ncbi:MAG: autorepressor SdpR family transcription factor [Ardenticatenaceae bacterium]
MYIVLGYNKTFKALSDGTRREILRLLSEKEMNAGEISSHFNISKPSISHHLNILKAAKLVQVERKGQERIYFLNMTVMQEFLTDLLEFFGGPENEL